MRSLRLISITGNDGKFRLQMSSVVCVHTNRFYVEFSTILSTLFGSISPSTPNERPEVIPEGAADSSSHVRVSLDIQAGAPVLLFPYSSTSRKLLVADLGHLSV